MSTAERSPPPAPSPTAASATAGFRPRRRFFRTILSSLLLVGILPIMVAGIVSESLARRVLTERTLEDAGRSADRILSTLEGMVREYAEMLDALARDADVVRAFERKSGLDPETTAALYDKMYYLLAGAAVKPALHMVGAAGFPAFSTQVLPESYDPSRFGNWGVLRRAAAADGACTFYAHGMNERIGEPVALSIARISGTGTGSRFFVIADLRHDQIGTFVNHLAARDGSSILVATGDFSPVYSRRGEESGPSGTAARGPAPVQATRLSSGTGLRSR